MEGKRLDDTDHLFGVLDDLGGNRDLAEKVYSSDLYQAEVSQLQNAHSQMDITGVPFFLVYHKDNPTPKGIPGAVSVEAWKGLLR